MQSIKVIKSKQVEATSKKPEKSKAGKVRTVNGTTSEPIVSSVRKSRASSCQRCPQREKGEGGTVVRGPARKPSCERRGRSSSTAPRTATKWPRTDPDYRRRGSSVDPKCRELIEQQGVRAESKHVSHRWAEEKDLFRSKTLKIPCDMSALEIWMHNEKTHLFCIGNIPSKKIWT